MLLRAARRVAAPRAVIRRPLPTPPARHDSTTALVVAGIAVGAGGIAYKAAVHLSGQAEESLKAAREAAQKAAEERKNNPETSKKKDGEKSSFATWFDSAGRRHYEGPFESPMTRREAALILGVRETANVLWALETLGHGPSSEAAGSLFRRALPVLSDAPSKLTERYAGRCLWAYRAAKTPALFDRVCGKCVNDIAHWTPSAVALLIRAVADAGVAQDKVADACAKHVTDRREAYGASSLVDAAWGCWSSADILEELLL